jgi:hypothetical protein
MRFKDTELPPLENGGKSDIETMAIDRQRKNNEEEEESSVNHLTPIG